MSITNVTEGNKKCISKETSIIGSYNKNYNYIEFMQ